MRVIVTGPKSAGKTTVSHLLAERLDARMTDVDDIIVALFSQRSGRGANCAEIYRTQGAEVFRALEREAIAQVADDDWCVIATGGSSLLDPRSRDLLRASSAWFYLDASPDYLWRRLLSAGAPAFLDAAGEPEKAFREHARQVRDILLPRCDCVIAAEDREPGDIADEICAQFAVLVASRSGAPNTFGEIIRLTTFGESHGPMIGAVLDGVPPGIPLEASDIQRDLDRRRPGQSAVSTQRRESDSVEIVSGVFEGRTTGTPIALLIRNTDSRPGSYDALRDVFRPGHADFTFQRKYGIRDHRGGGRSSGRETACRVAGGAVARKILAERGVTVRAYAVQIGDVTAEAAAAGEGLAENSVRCGDAAAAARMEQAILAARSAGDSLGGVVEARVEGLPAGLGDPVFGKLDARLAMALFSIGAVKGVELGAGFASACMRGSENNDQMLDGEFVSNNAGGILGGISTGQPVVVRVAVKPTPSIAAAQKTVDLSGRNRDLTIEGRHDPCIVPRIVPVVESMIALVLFDAWEIQRRIRPGWPEQGKSAVASGSRS